MPVGKNVVRNMHLLVLLTVLHCFLNVQKILKIKTISCFSVDGVLLVCEVLVVRFLTLMHKRKFITSMLKSCVEHEWAIFVIKFKLALPSNY